MLHFLPATLRGVLVAIAMISNVIFFGTTSLLATPIMLLLPLASWRLKFQSLLVENATLWIRTNGLIFNLFHRIHWDFRGANFEELDPKGRYLVVSNHQSWTDVLVLQRRLTDRIPFLRFFIKSELIYLPFLGQAWWALGMPFMKRYSPEYLKRHPEKRGKDLEATRRSCERFRTGPLSIMNFLEGTRFTPAKRDRQESPHRHLLRSKAGGFAQVLDALGGELSTLVNITVVYVGGPPTIWEYVCGKTEHIVVNVEVVEIPENIRHGDYRQDEAYKARVQQWVSALWEGKDAELDRMLGVGDEAKSGPQTG
ncbi:MAG: 1-acyl-sn-glycerol-3-phosphate acyltransferase [Hyphomicrobiaceae bacterium]|jgi:1-acyl-sn-glycerol-3-phosphate acyltransferase